MAPKVYLETSVISYLAARPSRDVVVLAHQELTRQWWETRRAEFEVFVSEIVVLEAGRGDPDAARARTELIRSIPRLSASRAAEAMVPVLLRETGLPARAYARHGARRTGDGTWHELLAYLELPAHRKR